MDKIEIALFAPEKMQAQPLELYRLNKMTGKKFQYAAKGRYAIWHILKVFCSKGNMILLPAYFCPSVLQVIHQIGLYYKFYDLDIEDLNPSVFSIEKVLKEESGQVKAVIVPSFYGNPADLSKIWNVCRKYGAFMLDDAAQSFGATLNGRYVGTFGDGGMFAFSPGKATPGHMGSFFWNKEDIVWKRSRHPIYHMLFYKNYIRNRVESYKRKSAFSSALRYICVLWDRLFFVGNDRMEPFEEELIGGFLWGNLSLAGERRQIHKRFAEHFSEQKVFRVIQASRGEANPCKVVLLFQKENECSGLKAFLAAHGICSFGGYQYLPGEVENLVMTKKIVNHVIELPIERDALHMDYIYRVIEEWFDRKENER